MLINQRLSFFSQKQYRDMKPHIFFILFFLCFLKTTGQKNDDQKQVHYPIPKTKNLLFYIQRSTNINTIVYDLNYSQKDSINTSQPVNVYWIKYADDNKIKPISVLERKYAYGVSSEIMNAQKKWFKIHIKAYKKIDIYVMNSLPGSSYHAYLSINGKLAKLSRIFFNIDGGTFWNPNVTYIELLGQDIKTGKPVIEKFKP